MSKDTVEEPQVEAGTDLVPIDQGRLLDVLDGTLDLAFVAADADEIGRRMAAEAKTIATEEDLWKETATWGTKSNIGVVFEVRSLRGVYPSKFKAEDENGAQGKFVAWEAVNLLTGEVGILNTSAMRINRKLAWYYDHGKLPVKVEVVKRGESSNGFDILDIDKAD
jgi:hypothetical protein